jgi:putative peptidoglycan lipid II flippase
MLGATALASGLALVSNLALFWREVMAAAMFGVGAALDAFIVASLLPLFAGGLLAGALAPALAPLLAARRQSLGAGAAPELIANFHLWAVLGSVALALALWVATDFVLGPMGSAFDAATRHQVDRLYVMLLPVVPLQMSSAVWKLALNMQRRVALAALTPALAPLSSVGLMLATPGGADVELLAWGLLGGSVLEWALLAVAARRTHCWTLRACAVPPAARALRGYATLLGAAAFTTSAWLIDNAMASTLTPGSVAALGFGGKVVTFGIGIVTIGLSTALLPVAAELVASAEWKALRRLALCYGAGLFALCAPAALALYAWSAELIAALYERGAFDAADTELVAGVQAALALQAPFHVVGVLCVRLLAALQMNRHVLIIAAAGTGVNVVLNLVLMNRWGVVGIAAATSAMFMVTALAAARVLHAELARRIDERRHMGSA